MNNLFAAISVEDKVRLGKAVVAGAMYLNSRRYKWIPHALSQDFDMASPTKCLLSKLFGTTFTGAYYKMGWGYNEFYVYTKFELAYQYGFFSNNRNEMHFLTMLWKELAVGRELN